MERIWRKVKYTDRHKKRLLLGRGRKASLSIRNNSFYAKKLHKLNSVANQCKMVGLLGLCILHFTPNFFTLGTVDGQHFFSHTCVGMMALPMNAGAGSYLDDAI